MSYATLGTSCMTSMSTLVDNSKFLSINDGVYKKYYTNTQIYPLEYKQVKPKNEEKNEEKPQAERRPEQRREERDEEIKTGGRERYCSSCNM